MHSSLDEQVLSIEKMILHWISLDKPLLRRQLCIFIVIIALYTSERETLELQTSAQGEALPEPVGLINLQPPRHFGCIQSEHTEMAYRSVVSQLGRRNDT